MQRSRTTSIGQAGFTLLEVLVALGILATSYVALLQTLSGSVRLSAYGREVTAAAFLAQAKMEQVEEKLVKDGFPVDSETKDGTFEDAGYPGYRWKMEVRRVELPIGEALNYLMSNRGGKDEKKSGATDKVSDESLAKLLSAGGSGIAGLGSAMTQGGGMGAILGGLGGSPETLSKQMEDVLREMQLTVEWGAGGPEKRLVVTTHIVNLPQATGAQSSLTSAAGAAGVDLSKLSELGVSNAIE